MEFYNLDKDRIRSCSEIRGDYYVFTLGSRIEVISTKKSNSNDVLSNFLSSEKKEDRMMIKYYPSNTLYFDRDFIDSDASCNFVSCKIDKSSFSVYIGKIDKYEIKSGVLAFTGVLSSNNYVESMRYVYSNSQLSDSGVKSKVKLISVGMLGDSLFGLYLLPKERGIAISADSSMDLSYSVKTWNLKDYSTWSKCCVNDWFKASKITV